MNRPTIAVTSGEPAGIGPELVAMLALRHREHAFAARLVIVGDRELLVARAARIGAPAHYADYDAASFAPPAGAIEVWHQPLATPVTPGHPDATNAHSVLTALGRACDACATGMFSALVTAPVQKSALMGAGIPFAGHTEFFARRTQTPRVVMMLVGGAAAAPLRVALVTTHIPQKDVPAAITRAAVDGTLAVLLRELTAKVAIASPRIAVCGLNPHAGEAGHLGREEIDVIAPAIAQVCAEGIDARGPLSPDTVFLAARRGDFDAVVSMYHDQGQIAMKLLGFDSGVTLHGGLPVPVTTCASGTAFDIVGRNVANVDGLVQAWGLAARIAAKEAAWR